MYLLFCIFYPIFCILYLIPPRRELLEAVRDFSLTTSCLLKAGCVRGMNIRNISTFLLLLFPTIIVARIVEPAKESIEYLDDEGIADQGSIDDESYPIVVGVGGPTLVTMAKPKVHNT